MQSVRIYVQSPAKVVKHLLLKLAPGWKGARDRAITRDISAGFRVNLATFSRAFPPLSAQISRFCANLQTKNGEIVRQRQLARRRCESRFLCARNGRDRQRVQGQVLFSSAILPGPTFKGVPVARREP